MSEPVLNALPTLQDVERAISRNARDAALLRALRNVMRKNKKFEDVGKLLSGNVAQATRDRETMSC